MPIPTEALRSIEEALDDAAQAISTAINSANEDAPRSPVPATEAGVVGIESSDPQVIAAVLRIAEVVGQTVTIDYRDEYGRETQGREVNPQKFVDGSTYVAAHVIAEDLYRDGETRRFRLDRIQRVRTA